MADSFSPLRQTDKHRRLASLFGGLKRGDGSRAPRSAASLQFWNGRASGAHLQGGSGPERADLVYRAMRY